MRQYFTDFPLKTKKSESFNKWNSVYSMVLGKEHLVQEVLVKFRVLAKEVNAVIAETA